jgi:hypothetical protein
MILKSITYKELENTSKHWELQKLDLENINLIVGLNGIGKSRVLRVVNALALLFYNIQKVPYSSGYFDAIFEGENNELIHYSVCIENSNIKNELLEINGEKFLERNESSTGKIKNLSLNQMVDFEIPLYQAAVTRRDKKQYPFLETLFEWANSMRYFRFNQEIAKNSFSLKDLNKSTEEDFNLRETDKVIRAFTRGQKAFPYIFDNNIIRDFNSIGYSISSISLGPLRSVKFESQVESTIIGINVKETDLEAPTDQLNMSDGMFRALSIIIHVNLYQLENTPTCILVDDIGEGLDFERATSLIKLIIEKAQHSKFQLILTTNDKFVMNNIDLGYWNIIFRDKGVTSIKNKRNDPKIFEEFKYTGLSNFDFFSSGFFNGESAE